MPIKVRSRIPENLVFRGWMFDAIPRKIGVQDQNVAGLWAPNFLVLVAGSSPGTPEKAPGVNPEKNLPCKVNNLNKALHLHKGRGRTYLPPHFGNQCHSKIYFPVICSKYILIYAF